VATLLGIEVGTRTVRAALVRTQLRSITVARYTEVSLDEMRMLAAAPPPMPVAAAPIAGLPEASALPMDAPAAPAPVEGTAPVELAADAPLRLAIAEVLKRMGVSSATIVADMPGEDVSLRRLELPPAAARRLDELLPFEMESLIPFDAAETLLDHQLAEPPEPTKIRVVVCAVTRAKVRARLDVLANAGADPEELVPGPVALGGLAMLMPVLATEAPQMLVHVGYARTDVAILRKGKLELARSISAGLDDVREVGFAREAPYGSGAERLYRELRQTLATHRMQNGADLEAVRVSGDVEAGEALLGWLGAALDKTPIPLEMPAAPEVTSATIGVPGGAPADPLRAPAFALALGLAGQSLVRGKHLDLRRGDLAKKRSMGAMRELAPLIGVCASFVIVAYFYSVYAHWSVLTARRAVLEAELEEVTTQRLGEGTRSASQARTLLEQGRQSPDPLPAFDAFDALLALSNAIPDGIDHDVQRLQIELGDDRSGGHVELQAVVSSIEERDRISEALGEVPCFRNLELGPMTQSGEGRRQYRLEMDLQCPGTATTEGGSRRGRGRGRRSGGSASGSGSSSSSGGGSQ
jgi:general secretion pathway protein L